MSTSNNIRSATSLEKSKAKVVGFSAFLIVLMLTIAVTFTAIVLNPSEKPKEPADEVSGPIAFALPVSGEWTLLKECSFDEIQFNATVNRWESHKAVDIAAEAGTAVVATYAGTITSVANSSSYGTTVTIEHKDGLKTVYSSLDSNVNVSKGDYVEKGQRIGLVGTTASAEENDPPHVHLEVYKNNVKVNPADYIDFTQK